MLIDLNRLAAAICPDCSEAVIANVSAFSFSGGHSVKINCPSKGCFSECVSILPKGKKMKITLKCPFCGDFHSFVITANKFWHDELITFPCPETGISSFFFGMPQKVHEALEKSLSSIEQLFEATINELYNSNGLFDDDNYDDDYEYDEEDILLDILDELDELRSKGALSCVCGSEAISVNPIDGSILLSCPKCRRSKLLEVCEQTLEMIINASAIVLDR